MLFAVDKPTWISTFDIIRRLRKTYPKLKMWHCGTLDPLATGLVIIWTEKDTKQMTNIIWLDKVYTTTIDFSQISDTRDIDFWEFHEQYIYQINGDNIIFESQNTRPARSCGVNDIYKKIVWLLDSIIWNPELPLPTFSAKKMQGKKLYELARQWIDAQQTREMKIYSYEILDFSFPKLSLRLSVWSGTYIRSIGFWLGQELWIWWILSSLRRESIWNLDINKLELEYLPLSEIYISEVEIGDIINNK